MTDEIVTQGHNRPPLLDFYKEQNAALPDYLSQEHADMITNAAALKAEFESNAPSSVDTDEAEILATDMGGRLQKFLKLVDAQRVIDKAPTLQASRIVDNFYNDMTNKVSPCLEALRRRINVYKDQKAITARRAREDQEREARRLVEEARLASAEAERLKNEASDAEASKEAAARAKSAATEARAAEKAIPTVAAATTTAGSAGTQSMQKMAWVGEITDFDGLDLNALRPYISRSELDKAVQRYAVQFKDTQPLVGAKIYEKSNTSFKG